MKKYKNRIVPTNISRVDSIKYRYHGFQVRIYTMAYSKMFPDKLYGGWTKALNSAIIHLEEKHQEYEKNGINYIRNYKKFHLNSRSKKYKNKLKTIAGISLYAYWSKRIKDYRMYFLITYNPEPYKQMKKIINVGYFNSISENKLNIKYKECIEIRKNMIEKIDEKTFKKIENQNMSIFPKDLSLAIVDKRKQKNVEDIHLI